MTGNHRTFETTLLRLGGDRDLFSDLVRFFFEDYPDLVNQLRNGIARKNADVIEHAAHRIKGLVSNFDYPPPIDASVRLELMGRSRNLDGADTVAATLDRGLSELAEWLAPFKRPA
jgi:HPt (histidine-containing phosphotransfer) domain-containing protein